MLSWNELPDNMRTEVVRPYYEALLHKKNQLVLKRMLDVGVSVFLLIVLFPLLVGIGVWVALGSEGGVFFCQDRVTAYGKTFTLIKFRTMVKDAPKLGGQLTTDADDRITKEGRFLRKYRLDELPQLINILTGDMSLVGTRPEVPKYVEEYTDEMRATLLLPAGVTSEASIRFRDEAEILEGVSDKEADEVYMEKILPEKMKYNLNYIKKYSFTKDIALCFMTVFKVFGENV